MTWKALAAAILALVGWAGAAQACSTSDDYVRPSNFELVELADAIVVATATPGRPDASPIGGAVTFTVTRTLKGTPPRRVEIAWSWIGPGGGMGMCNRSGFEAGKPYILFIGRGADGQWRRLGFPFAPDASDYDGENGVWMRTVRRYLALQRDLSRMDALAAMQRIAESGRDTDGRALTPDEREDAYDHLRSFSPWKPTPWLLDMYARTERGEPLPFPPPPHPGTSRDGEPRGRILRALALGDHPQALPFIERLSASPETRASARGPILRYFANHGRYDRAYDWIETRLMAQLVRLPEREALDLLADVLQVQQGDRFEDERARWRSDPRAAASWPELALALYWYRVRTFADDDDAGRLVGAIRAIPLPDRRARPEVTAALGASHDEETRDWAKAELARPQRTPPPAPADGGWAHPADRFADHPDLLPLRVIVSVWTAEDRQVLTRAFCEGGERRRMVMHALGQWGAEFYGGLLAAFAAAPDLSAEDLSLLRRAAILMDARGIGDWGTAGRRGEVGEIRRVSPLTRGERPADLPNPCRAAA